MDRYTIAAITKDHTYKDAFQNEECIELCLLQSKADFQSHVKLDALVVDGNLIGHTELSQFRSIHKNIPIFYKIADNLNSSSYVKNINLVCSGHNITPIHEGVTVQQVVKEVLFHLTGNNDLISQRVITFFGTHSGSGVTTTTRSVARLLGQRATEKVLVLSLNPWDPADYLEEYNGSYLNDLKVELKSRNLTPEKLTRYVFHTKYYAHLAGNRDVKLQRFYKPEEIEHLIDVAKQTFDVVLIDAGSHFDNACYAQAFMSSDLKFLVSTQNPKGYQSYFPLVQQQLIEPLGHNANDFLLILNQYKLNYSLINEKDIQEELEMSLLTTLDDQGENGSIAIRQKKLLYDLGSDEYKASIDTIVKTIFTKANLTRNELDIPKEEKKSFLSFLNKKKEEADVW